MVTKKIYPRQIGLLHTDPKSPSELSIEKPIHQQLCISSKITGIKPNNSLLRALKARGNNRLHRRRAENHQLKKLEYSFQLKLKLKNNLKY